MFSLCSVTTVASVMYFLKKKKKLIHAFLAGLALCCPAWPFSSCAEGAAPRRGARASHAAASLVADVGSRCTGFSSRGSRALGRGSVVTANRLTCSLAHGIFLDRGSNPCPLH